MTGMRIDIKSGEYYDYYDIKRIEILEHYSIKITGSFEKGRKSKTAYIHYESIKNIRELNRFLRKEMKLFQADGVCEHCGSLNVQENKRIFAHKILNIPKAKNKEEDVVIDGYRCNACRKLFNDLKPIDLIIYYK